MTFSHALSTNNYGPAKFIVDASAANGTHTTIATALTSASSSDTIFIRPGTYTENLTLKAGVNLAAYTGDEMTPNVTIVGKATMSTAGTVTISNIRLQTNSDFFLVVSGSAASIVSLENCYLNCSNNTGISYTSSGVTSLIQIISCFGNLATTGIALFASSGSGLISFVYSEIANSGGSSTNNTASAGIITVDHSLFSNPITTSSTGALAFLHSRIDSAAQNTTALTLGGSGTTTVAYSIINSGSASSISVGGADVTVRSVSVGSTNINGITGAGTITYGNINFSTGSSGMNTTTQLAGFTRPGITLSSHQPAFLAYLPSTDLNKTGAAAAFTIGSATALTEVFDQGSNFNTNGTFTAPYTGKYYLSGNCVVVGATISTGGNLTITTSNRNYIFNNVRPAGTSNAGFGISYLCDMDAADTATLVITMSGEAGNTDDIFGSADVQTGFSGFLAF